MRYVLALLALLVLPAPVFAQAPTKPAVVAKAPVKAVPVAVKVAAPTKVTIKVPVKAPVPAPLAVKATVAKVVVTPATQMAHIVVAPASQPAPAVAVAKVAPASQPAPVAAWRTCLKNNWQTIVFVILIPSLITGLRKKGVREGIIGFLESVVERASLTQPHNSYGTLKWPGQAAGPPVDPPKPPDQPKA